MPAGDPPDVVVEINLLLPPSARHLLRHLLPRSPVTISSIDSSPSSAPNGSKETWRRATNLESLGESHFS
jgi:hypothetical protein